jgi:dCTP deaminase
MILSNVAIYEALDQGRIVITPAPAPRYLQGGQDSPYDTHSVDVRLAKPLSFPKKGPFSFDLFKPGLPKGTFAKFLASVSESVEIPASGFALEPGKFVLAQTIEHISLPIETDVNRILKTCIAARFEGKSSLARTGFLVHFTAPTIHPGFVGPITLEVMNLGPVDFILREGMPIGQLIFEEVQGLPIHKDSQFQNQNRPEGKV